MLCQVSQDAAQGGGNKLDWPWWRASALANDSGGPLILRGRNSTATAMGHPSPALVPLHYPNYSLFMTQLVHRLFPPTLDPKSGSTSALRQNTNTKPHPHTLNEL